jgi:DNA processing protein
MGETIADLSDWLIIRHTPGLGLGQLQQLLEQFGSAGQVRAEKRQVLSRAKLSDDAIDFLKQSELPAEVEAELRWAEKPGQHIIPFAAPDYPAQLKTIPLPPPVLYARGNHRLLHDPQLAIVGSRNPSSGGRDNARQFAHHFSRAGLVITSGLALGIDGAAHEGALIEKGPTIAVMATGADRLYPPKHKKLAESILEHDGLLITEMPLGTQPLPALFPQRNRIISGLSLGVLVVEAARRSGSLITARLAGEQGREVFAIPGSIHNPQARGCHYLIKQGAKLVESADDILVELASILKERLSTDIVIQAQQNHAESPLDDDHNRLLDAMGYDAVTIDQLVDRSGFSAKEVSSMLLILELEGQVRSEANGSFSRRAP